MRRGMSEKYELLAGDGRGEAGYRRLSRWLYDCGGVK